MAKAVIIEALARERKLAELTAATRETYEAA